MLSNEELLARRKRKAKRESAKKRRKRRTITQACIDIGCPSVKLRDRRDGRLGCNRTCFRITCPLEDQERTKTSHE